MNLPDLHILDDYIPIPEEFHSFETGKPFESCFSCQRPLLKDGTQYLIEKAFNRRETIFEYALCLDCRREWSTELSRQSLKLIEHYFDERVDLVTRRKRLLKSHPRDHRPWISTCVLSNEPCTPESEFQIFGIFDGGDLLFTYMPYAVSGKEIEALCQNLSKKTRDRMDAFVDDVLGIPGGHIDLPVLV